LHTISRERPSYQRFSGGKTPPKRLFLQASALPAAWAASLALQAAQRAISEEAVAALLLLRKKEADTAAGGGAPAAKGKKEKGNDKGGGEF
jgi:hypothetical protein